MSKFNENKIQHDPADESLLEAYAKANEVFDEIDAIEEEAVQLFGVTVEDIRLGIESREVKDWIKGRYEQAGWKFVGKYK